MPSIKGSVSLSNCHLLAASEQNLQLVSLGREQTDRVRCLCRYQSGELLQLLHAPASPHGLHQPYVRQRYRLRQQRLRFSFEQLCFFFLQRRFQLLPFCHQPLYLLGQLRLAGTQRAGQLTQQQMLAGIVGESPPAAEERDPDVAAVPLPPDDFNRPHFAGPSRMGAAAGVVVKVRDNYHTNVFADGWLFAKRHEGQFSVRDKPCLDGPVFQHDAVGQGFYLLRLLNGQLIQPDINGDVIPAEVKGDGLCPQYLDKRRREDVLPGVLLHVIKPPGPIDLARNLLPLLGQRSFQAVADVTVHFHHVDDADAAQLAQIAGLPSPCRVKGSAVQHHVRCPVGFRPPFQHACFKGVQIRIVIVQSVVHSRSLLPIFVFQQVLSISLHASLPRPDTAVCTCRSAGQSRQFLLPFCSFLRRSEIVFFQQMKQFVQRLLGQRRCEQFLKTGCQRFGQVGRLLRQLRPHVFHAVIQSAFSHMPSPSSVLHHHTMSGRRRKRRTPRSEVRLLFLRSLHTRLRTRKLSSINSQFCGNGSPNFQ